MLDVVMLLGGLALLVAGGQLLIRGASELAIRLHVAPVVIGLTVVAFGTSTPELVVNLAAALRGDSSIGFGNVVGSNIANVGLLLGITALVSPLVIHHSIITREIPMMLLASLAAVILGLNSFTDGTSDAFGRGDGMMLLLLFCVFLYYMINDAMRSNRDAVASPETEKPPASMGGLKIALCIIGGLGLLVGGGEGTYRGAIGVATSLGVPEVVVALTIVAVGTSLPELATSLIAAVRGQTDMAVGNIVGSNIFNMLFIWGVTTTISPTAVPTGGGTDLLVMTAFAAALLPMAMSQKRISRLEGGALIASYAGYISWLAFR
jgi:cation:H+ antiporter